MNSGERTLEHPRGEQLSVDLENGLEDN